MSLRKAFPDSASGTLREHSQDFFDSLLRWYDGNARDLPWRKNPQPYNVWISEIMSQQSTLAMMLPYFEKWMKRFPDLKSLAEASPDEVLSTWEGLGYYSRARNIHLAANTLRSKIKTAGDWPKTSQEWLELPGVGPYTAAAVASICFDEAILPVDGNVIRVFSRLLQISDPLNSPSDRKKIESAVKELAAELRPHTRGKAAQALMELGATICRPANNASCELCPVQAFCASFKAEKGKKNLRIIERTPRPKKRKAMKKLVLVAPFYGSHKPDQILLRQIPAGERLEGQWEVPMMDVTDIQELFLKKAPKYFEFFGPISHTITHHRYQIYGVKAGAWGKAPLPKGHRFYDVAFLHSKELKASEKSPVSARHQVTLSTVTRKLLHFLVDSAS